jgi:hypothetical protein
MDKERTIETAVTDEIMQGMLAASKAYCVMILRRSKMERARDGQNYMGTRAAEFSTASRRGVVHCMSGHRWRRDQRHRDF